ncbi:mycofactocin-coupled SDR family oxidoreductase [Arthrobacter sp. zg-Y859]|uniref:Mycofactocin-coupled SDR family oxidoreductase n=1 Tax=Arthrobacter jinronghuae TaxID=2964609 RepID=A0ABT1NQN0_9MICC|nr:mycofactocin-coupled SDR family oxidoreductase [Arthrobacter jinronghuae]MCQ1950046.1 mycofactocin-coupled SDR family oxidoreductase [Arthrobacter jinronghuae]UWX80186.1 mycofactocin-coupled SDR family oxidoreductase [Arthrobacter jinronghuae]
MGRVEGKVAFITGAARGQGRSHAVRLAQEGADIIAVDLCDTLPGVGYPSATEEDLAQTVKEVEALDRRIIATKADVRDRAALQKAIDTGVAELGRLDIVVANAGICIMKPWNEVTPEIWNDTVGTNLTGVWNTVQLAAPHLVEAGGGSIILTSSAAGLKGLPVLTPYVAAKHGVVGIMRAFATELAEHNIRVNTVHPTGVDTAMASGDGMAAMGSMLEAHPRVGGMMTNLLPVDITQPVDISNAVLFLASDEARYVTSLAMAVDAGNTQY